MKYIYCLPNLQKSARLLATKLGLKATSVIQEFPPTIRYGNSRHNFVEGDTKFNSPESIILCGNSVTFSKFAKENKISSPLYIPFSDMDDYIFPFLLRKSHHIAGKDIMLVENKDRLDEIKDMISLADYFYVDFFKSDTELGIHVVNGRVVKIFKKVDNGNVTSNVIRSSKFGWHYHLVSNIEDNFQIAQKIVLDAFDKVKLGFGRADVGYNSADKKYIIFEINTSPGLNTPTAELYATELRQLIDV